jgi:hypothetical protein
MSLDLLEERGMMMLMGNGEEEDEDGDDMDQ